MYKEKLQPKEFKALFFIRNVLTYEQKFPSFRAIKEHLGFKSPRSAYVLVDRLIKKGYLEKTPRGNFKLLKDIDGKVQTERTVKIPLVGTAPCGLPLLAEENIEEMIPISQRLARPGARYFLLHAVGDSMNQVGIQDGDLALVRQQPVANEGERIVAVIDDSATIKEFHRKGGKIILMPRSSNPVHQSIIVPEENFIIQGVVIDTIPNPFN